MRVSTTASHAFLHHPVPTPSWRAGVGAPFLDMPVCCLACWFRGSLWLHTAWCTKKFWLFLFSVQRQRNGSRKKEKSSVFLFLNKTILNFSWLFKTSDSFLKEKVIIVSNRDVPNPFAVRSCQENLCCSLLGVAQYTCNLIGSGFSALWPTKWWYSTSFRLSMAGQRMCEENWEDIKKKKKTEK